MNKNHWMKTLDVEGWRSVFMNENSEPCEENTAVIYEQWIISEEVFVWTTRKSISEEWNEVATISPDDDWEVKSIDELINFIKLNRYPDSQVHPLLASEYNPDPAIDAVKFLSRHALNEVAANGIALGCCDED